VTVTETLEQRDTPESLLRRELADPRWRFERIAMGTPTAT
jgi:hypothetical protein